MAHMASRVRLLPGTSLPGPLASCSSIRLGSKPIATLLQDRLSLCSGGKTGPRQSSHVRAIDSHLEEVEASLDLE